ncbi:MAG TPA: sterol desaturase family protein [Myxococcaceae bacterium]|nr:sterol desaturase family protein [Myxococcaceae bacterium]
MFGGLGVSELETWLSGLSIPAAAALLLLENVVIFVLALAAGAWTRRRFVHRPVSAPPGPLERTEVFFVTTTVLLNTAVTLAGWALWRAGFIQIHEGTLARAALDTVVLLVAMDLGMYVMHRVAHARLLFGPLHAPHHRYENPRPLTLFVLTPLEAAGFGGMWLALLCVYPVSWLGMSVYLVLNVVFGVVGHLGVEPLPDAWARIPVLRDIGTSTFHARHHSLRDYNFGFYTLVWDRLFGTLDPSYAEGFGRPPEAPSPDAPRPDLHPVP